MSLAHTRVGQEHARHHLVMLHGIYGRGRNWQGIAKAIIAARTDYACWLVDLPYHGDSGPGTHGDSVKGFAADLDDWAASLSIIPDIVLGHSFGGKVALAYADRHPDRTLQVWSIDSTPATKPRVGSAFEMLTLIRKLPNAFASRDEAIDLLVEGGFPKGVAVWMATNLKRDGSAFVWSLDFDAMDRLLDDFITTDLWHVVERHAADHDLHFLKATESSALSDEAEKRIEAITGARVHLHRRPGSHWIHSESPQVVIDLLLAHLP